MRKYKNLKRIKSFLEESYKLDYNIRPVDILTFISDDYYLGKVLGNEIFDVWKNKLQKIFLDDEKFLVVLTGAIGIGKTTIAIISCAYVMYRLMCLRNPWEFFGLSDSGSMNITFFNLTKSLGSSRGFNKLQHYLLNSPWFLERGRVTGDVYKQLNLPLFRYSLASPFSKGFGSIGEDVVFALMDEVDSPTESESSRLRVLQAYEATVRRFISRFVRDNRTVARFFLVASKQDEMSFLNVFIEKMKNSGMIYVVDIPYWEAKPNNYSGKVFPVLVGDVYTPPRILDGEDPEIINSFLKMGHRIINVPIEHLNEFERDTIGSLKDIAGIAIQGIRKSKLFPSEKILIDNFDKYKEETKDPISVCPILIGLQDEVDLIHYINLRDILEPKHIDWFIHYDISITGDSSGLAMSGISNWVYRDVEKEDGTFEQQEVPIISTVFVFKLSAKEGDEIPIHKIRKLVIDLKGLGFNIRRFTADLRMGSADTLQILKKAGITADYMSVDRDIKSYMTFRDIIFEKRWKCFKNEYLYFELKHLDWDRDRNKVDHPKEVKDTIIDKSGNIKDIVLKGSKDMSDSVCGSVYSAIQFSEKRISSKEIDEISEALKDKNEEPNKYWWVKDARENKKIIGEVHNSSDIQKFIDILDKAN